MVTFWSRWKYAPEVTTEGIYIHALNVGQSQL